ncbi:MAG: putative sulfate exporter family transporter [Pseudomonadota bacterium]
MIAKRTNPFRGKWPGLSLALLLGLIAYWLASFHEATDALVVGIIFGMVVRTIMGDRPRFLPGLNLAPKLFIPLGVIFYGINLKFDKLTQISGMFWLQLLIGIVAIFLVAIFLGRLFRIRDQNSFLIATGTAICGASAIAIATPVVGADSEDAGASLITITVFGLFGMLLYPLALTYFSLTKTEYVVLCATTLHMTGIVKTAAAVLGQSCLKLALSIKMARTAMIIPIIGFLCWYFGRREGIKKKAVFLRIPWFMWVFVAVGLLTSFVTTLEPLVKTLRPWAGICFAIALTSIGLTVDLRKMLNVGGAPLLVGFACWLSAIGVFLLISCF